MTTPDASLTLTPSAAAGAPVAVRIRRLHSDTRLPQRQSEHAAGLDLHARLDAPVTLDPGDIRLVTCGFAMAIPPGWEAQVRPRSGLATKYGVLMPNAPGTIDADYRGEVSVPLINLGRAAFVVEPAMRIAQMVIAPVAHAAVVEVDALDDTVRGGDGFGSTGH